MTLAEDKSNGQLRLWLQNETEPTTTDAFGNAVPPEKDADGAGLATSLYRLCCDQLSIIWKNLRYSNNRVRILIQDIKCKLSTFGPSFENGKLESCLNADMDLQHNIILLLHEIGKILAYGTRLLSPT